ncbi:SOS response-associated peptidase [Paenibacillus sp. YYML68]|uniref:SOS response-associated peptidase n=1 Tax=Paenibacillus sp. YYML68 TaxID=2909250 RepID=UPI002490AE55|nr:SOS response-associated peptidase [Paenibacillus sp. YYML68]
MCGRYTITLDWDELVLRFMLDQQPGNYKPRYNAAPGQMIPAIISGVGRGADGSTYAPANRLGELRWGLVPAWAQDDRGGARMINARSETAAEKPAFRQLLARKRCLIPADGFYEWERRGKSKQPIRFVLRSGEPFAMAALYDTWVRPDGTKLHTCSIMTTEPNSVVARVHDRMPVILTRDHEERWLDRRLQSTSELLPMLKPYAAEELDFYEVDSGVGKVSWDEPGCIERIESLPG